MSAEILNIDHYAGKPDPHGLSAFLVNELKENLLNIEDMLIKHPDLMAAHYDHLRQCASHLYRLLPVMQFYLRGGAA